MSNASDIRNSNVEVQVTDYAALRAYAGNATILQVMKDGIAGWFSYDQTDTTSVDNGGTIIVDSNNKRWKRQYSGNPDIRWFGAVGDGTTLNTSIFTSLEASNISTFYVPQGSFLSGLSILSKNYFGSGSVVTTNGLSHSGLSREEMLKKTSNLSLANALLFSNQLRAVTFIGDSITAGDGATVPSRKYAAVLQNLLNSNGINTQSNFLSGGMLTRSTTPVAPFSMGNKGVGKKSVILGVGGKLTFTADYVDSVTFRYARSPSSGTLSLTANGTNIGTISTAGTAQDDVLGVLTTSARGGAAVNYEIVCSGAPVEITGVFAYHALVNATSQPYFINFQAFSGYNTNNFNDDAVINSLIAQCPTPQFNFGVYVLAIGTNDIYNVTTANTSANYKANLEGIITKIRAGTGTSCSIVLTVPLNSTGTYASPILEPFDNYRSAVYELGRKYDLQVVDLSEIDLSTIGAFADGIHPNDYGHSILASVWYDKLFGNLSLKNASDVISLVSPATLQSGNATCTMTKNGIVFLSGNYTVSSITKGSQIASIPVSYAPLSMKVFTIPCWGGTGNPSSGSAIVTVNPSGAVVLFDFSPPNINYVSLDGISYPSLT